MPGPSDETQRPHFVLDHIDDETARNDLLDFQEVIYADPMGVEHALETPQPDVDTASKKYLSGIELATNLHVPDYDQATTRQIRMSATINQIQKRREENARNDTVSRELAADLRKERLRIFVQQVIRYAESQPTAEVLTLPDVTSQQSVVPEDRFGGKAS